jgi:shikimate dehydrogenase
MKQYGLLGFPLSHSFSKDYFTKKFLAEHMDAAYELYSLPEISTFPNLIQKTPQLAGLNVTIPYKQAVMPFLDEFDPQAFEIGAINVIRFEQTEEGSLRLKGYNSDLYGFRESMRPLLKELRQRLSNPEQPLKALVLGTGGASKAVLYGLKQLNIKTLLVSRQEAPNQLSYQQLTPEIYDSCNVVVNTTPLGMSPKTETCPPLDYSKFGKQHLLYDLVYNPDKTLFIQNGEFQGCIVKNGLEMLHLQAEEAWRIWNK